MLANVAAKSVMPFTLRFGLVHYVDLSPLYWQCQLQATHLDDTGFSSPDISVDTTVDTTGWFVRSLFDGVQTLVPWPAGGFIGYKSDEVDMSLHGDPKIPVVAHVDYRVNQAGQLKRFTPGQTLLVRAHQSYDQGATWGDWVVWERQVV